MKLLAIPDEDPKDDYDNDEPATKPSSLLQFATKVHEQVLKAIKWVVTLMNMLFKVINNSCKIR